MSPTPPLGRCGVTRRAGGQTFHWQRGATMPPDKRLPLRAVVVPVCAVLLGGYALWRALVPGPDRPVGESGLSPVTPADPVPQPWELFPSDFRNTHPAVQYVGDAACARCHAAVDQCYHQHPMGRSAARLPEVTPVETRQLNENRSVTVGAHRLNVSARGTDMVHQLVAIDAGKTPPYEVPVQLAIGSGTQGRSYLTTDRGALWQSPISWFANPGRWDVSPGFELSGGGRRPVPAECLNCHLDRTAPLPRTRNSFREVVVGQAAIGCERCHGPGERHVSERTNGILVGQRDNSIANPKHMTRQFQLDVCRQCHLLGEQSVVRRGLTVADYRPGLPLEQFRSVYLPASGASDGKSVGHFEQMERSRCFSESGTMTCTTCHDPHRKPAPTDTVRHFRTKCQTCHADDKCKENRTSRQSVADNCVKCHMPRGDSTNVAHAAVTNHAINRRPSSGRPAVAATDGSLVRYYQPSQYAPAADELERDLGIALRAQLGKLPAGPQRAALLEEAARRLSASVRRWPADEPALVALAEVEHARGDRAAGLAAARAATRASPESEYAWMTAWNAEREAGNLRQALAAADRLTAMSPSAVDHHLRRAYVLLDLKNATEAEASCRQAIAIHPQLAEARIVLTAALTAQNRHAEARQEADQGLALAGDTTLQRQLRDWLQRQR